MTSVTKLEGCPLKTSSLPARKSEYSGLYQNNFKSQNLLASIQNPPMRSIKEHKFGSVITLKERSLWVGVGPNPINYSGGGFSSKMIRNRTKKEKSEKCVMHTLFMIGSMMMLISRLAAFVVSALLVGPWIFMIDCKFHLNLQYLLVIYVRMN